MFHIKYLNGHERMKKLFQMQQRFHLNFKISKFIFYKLDYHFILDIAEYRCFYYTKEPRPRVNRDFILSNYIYA